MRRAALLLVLVGLGSCRPLPPPDSPYARGGDEPAASEQPARPGDESAAAADMPADTFRISERAAAIIDSVEAAVRDSFAALRAEAEAERNRADSLLAAARADSIAAEEARRDSIAAEARRDSIAAAARQDSIAAAAAALEAARQDSIAEAARRDSIAAVARRDSIAEAARQDSIAAAEVAAAAAAAAAAEAREDAAPPSGDPQARAEADLEALRALGPSYIPYDEGPETIWSTETQATLSKTLLPVLRAESLPATTRTIFWVLISREGKPVESQIQTSSGNESFDEAAEGFLRGLTFLPAMRDDRPVASWVLREISILMQ